MNRQKKLLIIGPILPPIGGISIHIDRIADLFKDDYVIDYIDESRIRKEKVFNLRSFDLITYKNKISAADIIYIHSVKRIQRYFHLIACKMTHAKIIFSIHTYPKALGFPMGLLDRSVFGLADRIILVNPQMESFLNFSPDKIFVKHAFLPPVLKKEQDLPVPLVRQIEMAKSDGKTIIASNGWKLELFNGEDMYGLDICMKAVQALVQRGFSVLFVFNVSSIQGVEDYYHSCVDQIRSLNMEDSFLLINERISFVKLIQLADMTVRATNTDGDSLSVRESLFLNKPVIASDVIERPQGTLLFKSRNALDLEIQIETCIRNKYSSGLSSLETREDIKEFYESVFAI